MAIWGKTRGESVFVNVFPISGTTQSLDAALAAYAPPAQGTHQIESTQGLATLNWVAGANNQWSVILTVPAVYSARLAEVARILVIDPRRNNFSNRESARTAAAVLRIER